MRHTLNRVLRILKKSPASCGKRGEKPIHMRHTLKRALRIWKRRPACHGGEKRNPIYMRHTLNRALHVLKKSTAHFESKREKEPMKEAYALRPPERLQGSLTWCDSVSLSLSFASPYSEDARPSVENDLADAAGENLRESIRSVVGGNLLFFFFFLAFFFFESP